MLKLSITVLLIVLVPGTIIGQGLVWKNFTTDHGLPGNIVYDQVQDKDGYIWFATNHGICRFNGYEFVQPVDTSNFRGTESFSPAEDAEGNIWFSRIDASLWIIEKDTIRAWKHNEKLAPYLANHRPISNLKIAKNGDVWLSIFVHGFLVVDQEGHITKINQADDSYFDRYPA